jgi:hypothetical protein
MFRTRTLTVVVLLLCMPVYAQSQTLSTVEEFDQAMRLAENKLWKVMEITKRTTPKPSAEVVLEAPKGHRERLTLHGEEATELVVGDVITFKHDALFITTHPGGWSGPLEFDRPDGGTISWQAEKIIK